METTKDTLKEQLKTSILNVTFRKKDDTIRDMKCTLLETYLPKLEQKSEVKKEKAENNNNISVWDIDKNSWRSFRLDSIIKIETV
jgi:hypothetical protein